VFGDSLHAELFVALPILVRFVEEVRESAVTVWDSNQLKGQSSNQLANVDCSGVDYDTHYGYHRPQNGY
jgi:hypothetical protein